MSEQWLQAIGFQPKPKPQADPFSLDNPMFQAVRSFWGLEKEQQTEDGWKQQSLSRQSLRQGFSGYDDGWPSAEACRRNGSSPKGSRKRPRWTTRASAPC